MAPRWILCLHTMAHAIFAKVRWFIVLHHSQRFKEDGFHKDLVSILKIDNVFEEAIKCISGSFLTVEILY